MRLTSRGGRSKETTHPPVRPLWTQRKGLLAPCQTWNWKADGDREGYTFSVAVRLGDAGGQVTNVCWRHMVRKKQQTDQIDGILELLEETMLRGKPIEPHNAEFLRKFRGANDRLLATKRRIETTRARRKKGQVKAEELETRQVQEGCV